MSHPPIAPEARYAGIVEALLGNPGVTHSSDEPQAKKGFGARGQLKVNDKIFAMLVRGKLVVKLPRPRVDALVAAGAGNVPYHQPPHAFLIRLPCFGLVPAIASSFYYISSIQSSPTSRRFPAFDG